jgi:mannan endo-1,4-beta-mannosidase
MPFAYYFDRSFTALDVVKANQFNAVRIVWCADNLVRAGRCEPKDFRPIQDLERVLARMRELELVAVMNLQNATGSNDPGDLIKMSEWYMREDVKKVLNLYKDMLIINIANEWYGAWDDPSNIYVDTYLKEISRLRNAELDHTLIIDARGWGQQFSSIIETARTLMNQDNNLLFSTHIYDIFSTPDHVKNAFHSARQMQIPLVVGEFACVHYPGQKVPCSTVMEQAEKGDPKIGTLAWSFSGNSGDLKGLDMYDSNDWTTLTPYGQQIAITDPYSVAKTARTACLFPGQACDFKI